jgi:CRP/FNR family cyclic AMP-dependent transcriptional regulator
MMDSGMDIRIEQLARVSAFRQFGHTALKYLAEAAKQRQVAENTTIVHLDDTSSCIYVVIRGKVRLSVPLSDGREFIFADLGPDEVFDLSNLFVTQRSRMNAISILETDLLQIRVASMAYLFDRDPVLALKVIPYFCQATRDAQDRVIQSAANTLSVRLANTLLRITDEPRDIADFDAESQSIRLSQTDLAAMVPASREKVNRCLREWERRDLTQYDNGSLTILDRDGLKSVALGEEWAGGA